MKSCSVTIQMKVTEKYFPVALFILLCGMVLTFYSVDKILKSDIQMKATGLSSTSLAILYKMVLTFESVDEILKCDHSNESY